jgi:hypothetical protein
MIGAGFCFRKRMACRFAGAWMAVLPRHGLCGRIRPMNSILGYGRVVVVEVVCRKPWLRSGAAAASFGVAARILPFHGFPL